MKDTLGNDLPTCEQCGIGLDPRVLATKPTAIAGYDGSGYRIWCYTCVREAQELADREPAGPAWELGELVAARTDTA